MEKEFNYKIIKSVLLKNIETMILRKMGDVFALLKGMIIELIFRIKKNVDIFDLIV